MMHVSLFASPEPILRGCRLLYPSWEWIGRFSSLLWRRTIITPLNQFGPLPTGPYDVAFDHDRESISRFHDKSVEIENSWAMESCEALTLEFIGTGSTNKHGSFILDTTHEHACITPIQSLPCLVHQPHMRAVTTFGSSIAECLEGWLWMHMFTISISDFVCALWC
jgi:hypothetical protein